MLNSIKEMHSEQHLLASFSVGFFCFFVVGISYWKAKSYVYSAFNRVVVVLATCRRRNLVLFNGAQICVGGRDIKQKLD